MYKAKRSDTSFVSRGFRNMSDKQCLIINKDIASLKFIFAFAISYLEAMFSTLRVISA